MPKKPKAPKAPKSKPAKAQEKEKKHKKTKDKDAPKRAMGGLILPLCPFSTSCSSSLPQA